MTQPKHLGGTVAGCLFSALAAGCVSAPPLDRVSLVEATLASRADLERYAGSGQYRDTLGHPLQFDDIINRMGWPWPYLKLVLQSDHPLFNTESVNNLAFYLCEANARSLGLSGRVVWKGRTVTPGPHREVAELMKAAEQPQQYELFFAYVYYEGQHPVEGKWSATLLPLPEDLCVAAEHYNYPFRTSIGRPLRISKDLINAALGPLPREIVKDD